MDTFHSCKRFLFLSTPSARRATYYFNVPCRILWKFLSTPSARRATTPAGTVSSSKVFLSTPSARRATIELLYSKTVIKISIHALREEGDK